jgi:hypothetical protein
VAIDAEGGLIRAELPETQGESLDAVLLVATDVGDMEPSTVF